MTETIKFIFNHKPIRLKVDTDRMLLWVIRSELEKTGTKYGCGEGLCGACTVLVNNEAVKSCNYPIKEIKGKEIITIEGLSEGGGLHPLHRSFMKHDALQCGYCTPGMILNAYSLLLKIPEPTEEQIIDGMEDVLCRCGCYARIIQAIKTAAQEKNQ